MTLNEMVEYAGVKNLDKDVVLRTIGGEDCTVDGVLDERDGIIMFHEGECP